MGSSYSCCPLRAYHGYSSKKNDTFSLKNFITTVNLFPKKIEIVHSNNRSIFPLVLFAKAKFLDIFLNCVPALYEIRPPKKLLAKFELTWVNYIRDRHARIDWFNQNPR